MSLLASILVRPRIAPALLATFSIATAVAVAEALRRATGIEARLKWPNDVLARGRKLAGILVETRILTNAGTGVSEPPRTLGRPPTVDADLAGPVTDAATRTSGRPPTVDADLAAPVTDAATRTSGRPPTVDADLAAPVTDAATRTSGRPPTVDADLAAPVPKVVAVGRRLPPR